MVGEGVARVKGRSKARFRDLTQAERTAHITRREELWSARQETTQNLRSLPKQGRGHRQFAKETSKNTWPPAGTIQVDLARSKAHIRS